MIEVHFCLLDDKPDEKLRLELLKNLPSSLRQVIEKYQFREDQDRTLTGFLLLKSVLEKFQEGGASRPLGLEDLRRDEYQRPYLENFADFNITHSGQLIALAISRDQRIGIDTELLRELELTNFTTYMRPEEWSDIYAADAPSERFLHYWTIKESLMKAVGLGFRLPLDEIFLEAESAQIRGKKWYLKRLEISPGYTSFLATEIQDAEVAVFQHSWRNL